QNDFDQDNYLDNGDSFRATEAENATNTYAINSFVNKKFSSRLTVRAGVTAEYFNVQLDTRDRDNRPDLDGDGLPDWVTVTNVNDGLGLFQGYVHSKYRLNEKVTINAGLHGQYLDFNETYAVEPRLAVSWQVHPKHKLSAAYGLHNQMQPLPILFFRENIEPGVSIPTNQNLDFSQSNQFVVGYDWLPSSQWRVKVETYYQLINNVPVEQQPTSFSVLNAGSDFVFPERGSLVNEGIGTNYGVELTLEKFFSQGYYGLITASLYESTYEGSDGIERNTGFNNTYVVNVLAGKEFKLDPDGRRVLTFDMKLTNAGGRFYTPIDLEATRANAGREVLDEANAFSERNPAYFRLDTKFGFLLNSKNKKFSQQFYIDLQNVTNRQNVFLRRYNEVTDEINTVFQRGFFPDILYRIQF
ncbi:MAG: TonB-dependent receptor, partial [Bacteroidota bacterium]